MQGKDRGRIRAFLVTGQIAVSCVLLIGAGLLVRSIAALQDVQNGFESSGLVIVEVSPTGGRYSDDAFTRNFYRELLIGVASIAGVQTASLSSTVPPSQGGFSENITVEGGTPGDNSILLEPLVSPDYFRTMSIPLLAGRYFTDADIAGSPRVTVVSDRFAQQYFPGEKVVGKRLKIGGAERPNAPWLEIVGVVGDVQYSARDRKLEPVFYVPHAQNTMRSMYLVIRSSLPPSSLRSAVQQQIAALDRGIPVPEPRRIDDLLYESVAQPRFRTVLIASFAFMALLIAGVGLYGVIAYSIMQRSQEIGIRIALGAQANMISTMILREAVWLAAPGISVGILAALAMQKFVSGFLFGIQPTDLPTFAVVVAVLTGTCLLASYIPARRATRIDPIVSLK